MRVIQSLIIGYGSIGRKHAKILRDFDCQVSVVTQQVDLEFTTFKTINEALKQKHIDFIIIANPTATHHATLLELIALDFQGIVLVEKPIFDRFNNLPRNNIKKIIVGYNLRFFEIFNDVKQLISDEKIISFSASVGYYLPLWRLERDYRETYSAKAIEGGGVLNDLSHELDYAYWFCGKAVSATAVGGHYSDLAIESDDVYSIILQCERCPIVNIQINYLNRWMHREILINTQKKSIYVDLNKGFLRINNDIKQYVHNLHDTYVAQLKAILAEDYSISCEYEDGVYLTKLIETIKKANSSKTWIEI